MELKLYAGDGRQDGGRGEICGGEICGAACNRFEKFLSVYCWKY